MPQMFPLLWLILFVSSSIILSAAVSNIFFQGKKSNPCLKETASQVFHMWKW